LIIDKGLELEIVEDKGGVVFGLLNAVTRTVSVQLLKQTPLCVGCIR
jgi:hypothetical protein